MQQNIKWLQAQLRDLKGKPKDTPSDSDTLDSLSQKLKNKNLELEFQVLNYAKESAHLKTTYKNLFDPVNVTQSQTKTVTDSLQQKLHDVIYENAKLRAQLFDKVSEQMDITKGVDNTAKTRRPQPKSNTKNDRVPSASKNSCIKNKKVKVEEHHRNLQLSKNKIHMSSKCNNIKLFIRNDKCEFVCDMCKQCLITPNHDVCVLNYVNDINSHVNNLYSNVSNTANQKKHKPTVTKSKKVGYKERLASPKPRKPRTYLRWLPTERMFDLKGKIIESSESESQSDYSKENLKLLINFVWKFLGTIRLGNDHVPTILGYGDLQWGNILITRVYYVKSLGHNLFSIGQFCDSDLEVAFRRNTCFVRNLKGVDLLKGNRTTNLYTINLHEMVYVSPICLMARATSTKYWLSHQHLSHLNFDTINDLAKNDLVIGLLKFKYHKRLHLLHIDLCGPMRVKSINGKRYILVIVDDYSRYTWVHFIKSKGEAPEEIKIFPEENYSSSASSSHHPIATACYTQNRFIIHCRFNKTPYELINGKKSDISFLHVFGALYYPKNDREDIVKLGAKGDIGFFIAYSTTLCAYRVYNRRTNKIIETMNVTFDELSAMAFEQSSSKPRIQGMTFGQITMYDDYIGGQPSYATRTPTTSTTTADTAPTPTISFSQATNIPKTSYAKPTEKHLKEVKRIFRYLRRTVNKGLCYMKDYGFELTGFSDVDYAGCKDTFMSTSGGTQFLGEKLLSWSSKKQDCMALSTAEAEYVSLSTCCAQVIWMRTQLMDYGFHFHKILIYCDSKST
nr:hypothetical protein [Tanacetum cinerariifolium]